MHRTIKETSYETNIKKHNNLGYDNCPDGNGGLL